VETEVDAQSGVSDILNPAEVRQITAELRRQATKNLPPNKYSVMTSKTVISMGGAVLEECSEENCVITLGSKIGADGSNQPNSPRLMLKKTCVFFNIYLYYNTYFVPHAS